MTRRAEAMRKFLEAVGVAAPPTVFSEHYALYSETHDTEQMLFSLSETQTKVFVSMAMGMSTPEIVRALKLKDRTKLYGIRASMKAAYKKQKREMWQ